jgi:hypothetical protein
VKRRRRVMLFPGGRYADIRELPGACAGGPVRILLIHRGPVLSLGSGVVPPVGGRPITCSRVGHRTQSASPHVNSGCYVVSWLAGYLCVIEMIPVIGVFVSPLPPGKPAKKWTAPADAKEVGRCRCGPWGQLTSAARRLRPTALFPSQELGVTCARCGLHRDSSSLYAARATRVFIFGAVVGVSCR